MTLDDPRVADALRRLGKLKAGRDAVEKGFLVDETTGEVLKENDLKALVRQAMEQDGEDRWEYEGYRAELGPAKPNYSLDADKITPELLWWMWEHGMLQYRNAGYNSAVDAGALSKELLAVKEARIRGESARPLFVRPA